MCLHAWPQIRGVCDHAIQWWTHLYAGSRGALQSCHVSAARTDELSNNCRGDVQGVRARRGQHPGPVRSHRSRGGSLLVLR